MRPVLVVAPTRVKFGNSSLIDRAAGPLPKMMSSSKSSIAGYKTSSTALDKRCISSINNTSPGSSFVSIAAKSPALSRAGPEVTWSSASISLATI